MCAESLLEQNGYVRPREVIAIVAGTRTKSGSTNFMRLHVMGDSHLEGARFHVGPRPGVGAGGSQTQTGCGPEA